MFSNSLYTYVLNNPINHLDLTGCSQVAIVMQYAQQWSSLDDGLPVPVMMDALVGGLLLSAAIYDGLMWIYSEISSFVTKSKADIHSIPLPNSVQEHILEVEEIGQALISCAEAAQNNSRERKNNTPNLHHIIPRTWGKAAPARSLMDKYGVSINHPDNIVLVSAKFHSHMHTGAYVKAVNAYIGGSDSRDELLTRLRLIGSLIMAIDNYFFQ